MSKLSAVVLAVSFAASVLASTAPSRLPIINDDVARARAEARQRQVPVFVEVWAPW